MMYASTGFYVPTLVSNIYIYCILFGIENLNIFSVSPTNSQCARFDNKLGKRLA